ncbi:MAG: efflux RND transporter periplasmic adaptor subunit [Flavobacteriales bacterium]|nr:efflux RND transporter periplasmic adaptor subunit [Flavobacteriales bacterium]
MTSSLRSILLFMLGITMLLGCAGDGSSTLDEGATSRTPITVVHVVRGPIGNSVLLNATAQYLRKNAVRSNVTGRVEHAHFALRDRVTAGQLLYEVRTKEAEALGAITVQDSSFRVRGSIRITAPSSGVVVQMDKLLLDYVSDGDQLAVIADAASSVFVVNVPYELNRVARIGTDLRIVLPDSSLVEGRITMPLSTMDALSQTQGFVVLPKGSRVFPEGLVGNLRLLVDEHADGQLVPAECVIGNEEMTRFWVMRVVNDSTAVKVPITRGIVDHDRVEILEPRFTPNDRLVLTGGYGMADTARVIITPDR